jgi:hypothetical protein
MNTQTEIKSFYIPRVYMDTTEQYVKYIFNMAGVGMPYRVDFTPCGKVTGFKEDTRPSAYKSAFVHFHLFYDGADSVISFDGLNEGVFQTIEYEPYWRILKNRNPVSTTMMNVHQIVANCCALEEKVAKCGALEERITQLEDCCSDTFNLISHRITMLEDNFYKLADIVFDKSRLRTEDEDLSEKIECANLDSASVSTHSSMPSLEPFDGPTEEEIASAYEVVSEGESDEEDNPPIQYLDQVSDHLNATWLGDAIQLVESRLQVVRENNSRAQERMRCSADLCGNE